MIIQLALRLLEMRPCYDWSQMGTMFLMGCFIGLLIGLLINYARSATTGG